MYKLFYVFVVILASCSSSNPPAKYKDIPIAEMPMPPSYEEKTVEKNYEKIKAILFNDLLPIHYKDLSFVVTLTDISKAIRDIESLGGRVIYDPNLGVGSEIPFLVFSLPAESFLNKDILKSFNPNSLVLINSNSDLHMDSAPSDKLENSTYLLVTATEHVPKSKIGITGDRPDVFKTNGEDTILAVIDSGVDTSHPAVENQVIYSLDMNESTDVILRKKNVDENKVKVGEYVFSVPSDFDMKKGIYSGAFNENFLLPKGYDLNLDRSFEGSFKFLVGWSKKYKIWTAVVDINSNGKFDKSELEASVVDFNYQRNKLYTEGGSDLTPYVRFPSRKRTIKYPLFFKFKDDKPYTARISVIPYSHGTHVAGIAAGNGSIVKGVSPKTKIMAINASNTLGEYSSENLINALVSVFTNPYGYIPDVVNMSLGSVEKFEEDILNLLIEDFSRKFGTVFVIAAGNDGPGYRTINSAGNIGSSIQVGASVTKSTLKNSYGLSSLENIDDNNLFTFSSSGPSFTGQLRPNVLAPGVALSSTSITDSSNMGLSTFNGTSMAAPMVSGGITYLISNLKNDTQFDKLFDQISINRKLMSAHFRGEEVDFSSTKSLLDFTLGIRNSLEESAQAMGKYTIAQQGFGVINIEKAFDHFKSTFEGYDFTKTLFLQFHLNKGKKSILSNKVVDRSLNFKGVQVFELSLEQDYESDYFTRLFNLTQSITVKLVKVQEQSPEGVINENLEGRPFYISNEQNDKTLSEIELNMLAKNKGSFYSARNTKVMKPGHTYIAQYDVFKDGLRQTTLVDFVQVPFQTDKRVLSSSMFGNLVGFDRKDSVYFKKVSLMPLQIHRYPISLASDDTELGIILSIPGESSGSVKANLYSPSGKRMAIIEVNSSIESQEYNGYKEALFDTSMESGVYEIVVYSHLNARSLFSTHYSLLATAHKFKLSTKHVNLSLSKKTEHVVSISTPNDYSNFYSYLPTIKNYRIKYNDVPLKKDSFGLVKVPLIDIKDFKPSSYTFTMSACGPDEPNAKAFHGIDLRPTFATFNEPLDGSVQIDYSGRHSETKFMGNSTYEVDARDLQEGIYIPYHYNKDYVGEALGRESFCMQFNFQINSKENRVVDVDFLNESSSDDVYLMKLFIPDTISEMPFTTDSGVRSIHLGYDLYTEDQAVTYELGKKSTEQRRVSVIVTE